MTGDLCELVPFGGENVTYDGKTHRIEAGIEVILSLGAIQTPKVLMQSGLGDEVELQRLGIPVVQHLPGVGQNFQDHPGTSTESITSALQMAPSCRA